MIVRPSTASKRKTSPSPNAGACTQRVLFEQAAKGIVLGDEIALLRTNHLLGGSESSTFMSELNLVLKEVSEEMALEES